MRRIRVLRIIARMNVGGPALQVVGLTHGLNPERFDTRLLIGRVGPGEEDYLRLRAPDLPHRLVEGLGRSIRLVGEPRALTGIRRNIMEFQPDIVHTHTAKAGFLGRVAAWSSGSARTVHTFHGHLLNGYFTEPVEWAVRTTERALARRTTRLAAVGTRVRDELLEAGIGRPDQYVVVPPGVTLLEAPTREDARAVLGLSRQAPVVGFVARMTTVKRPERAIAVIRKVRARVPDVVLLVVGGGPLLDGLRREAADLGNTVRFLGWRSDVETIYSASDLVLLTSDNEGMPVSLIEAAICGTPAVATDVGSTGEVVLNERTGLLRPPVVSDLAAAVTHLLTDPDRVERLGAAAHDHARGAFSVERLVADTERLYEELAELAPDRAAR